MVYPSRLRENLKEQELKDLESIILQRDYLNDLSYFIKRKQGRFKELE